MTRTLLALLVRSELGEQPALGGDLSRQVDVVGQRHPVRIARGKLDLAARQRRPQRGDDVREAGLVGGHDIGVALDDDGQLFAAHGGFGEIDGEQGAALVEDCRGGRIQVLRTLAVWHDPATEADRTARLIADGNDDPAAELVDQPAAVRWAGQPRADELLVGEAPRAQPLGERIPGRRREADVESLQRLVIQLQFGQIRACALGLRRPEQHLAGSQAMAPSSASRRRLRWRSSRAERSDSSTPALFARRVSASRNSSP